MRVLWLVILLGCAGRPAPDSPAPPVEEPAEAPSEQAVQPTPTDEAQEVDASAPSPAEALPPGLGVEGSPCLSASDCASGICEGEGCGPDEPGVCAPAERGCTRDRRPFCGCDGETFFSSSSCPGDRFASRGTCPE